MGETTAAYDAVAESFADRWFDLRLEEPMARFTGRLGPGARVLDVGCGPGRDVAWLAEQGFDAHDARPEGRLEHDERVTDDIDHAGLSVGVCGCRGNATRTCERVSTHPARQ